jgi:hypothetical protein
MRTAQDHPGVRKLRRAFVVAVVGLAAAILPGGSADAAAGTGPAAWPTSHHHDGGHVVRLTPGTARPAVARPAAAPAGTLLAGLTSQRWPSFFRFAKNGETLKLASIGLDMTCTSGSEFGITDAMGPLAVKGHRFGGAWSQSPTAASGGMFSATGIMRGTFDRRHGTVSGTWDVHFTLVQTGGTTDTCDSGLVRFSARS